MIDKEIQILIANYTFYAHHPRDHGLVLKIKKVHFMKIPEDIYFFQLPRTNMLVENEKNVKFNFF